MMPALILRLNMTKDEIDLVIGALSFLEGQSMVDLTERSILVPLMHRLKDLVVESA